MDNNRMGLPMKLLVSILFLYLLTPVILVFPLSFSDDQTLAFPPSSWSLRWYRAIFGDGRMMDAFITSLGLATVVTLLSIVVALPASYAIVRFPSKVTNALFNLLTAPLLLPTIVLGLGILIVFASLGVMGSFSGLVMAHMTVTLPYALRVLTTSLTGLNLTVEEAAATLGARPMVVFRRITLPAMTPGLIAATALCFLVSFDEVVITLFLAGPRMTTLPVELYHRVEMQPDPLVATVSALIIGLTLAVVLIVDRSLGLNKTFVK